MGEWKGLDDFDYENPTTQSTFDDEIVYKWRPHLDTEMLKDDEANISEIEGEIKVLRDNEDYGVSLLVESDDYVKFWTPSHKHLKTQILKSDLEVGDFVKIIYLKAVKDGGYTHQLYKLLKWEE